MKGEGDFQVFCVVVTSLKAVHSNTSNCTHIRELLLVVHVFLDQNCPRCVIVTIKVSRVDVLVEREGGGEQHKQRETKCEKSREKEKERERGYKERERERECVCV